MPLHPVRNATRLGRAAGSLPNRAQTSRPHGRREHRGRHAHTWLRGPGVNAEAQDDCGVDEGAVRHRRRRPPTTAPRGERPSIHALPARSSTRVWRERTLVGEGPARGCEPHHGEVGQLLRIARGREPSDEWAACSPARSRRCSAPSPGSPPPPATGATCAAPPTYKVMYRSTDGTFKPVVSGKHTRRRRDGHHQGHDPAVPRPVRAGRHQPHAVFDREPHRARPLEPAPRVRVRWWLRHRVLPGLRTRHRRAQRLIAQQGLRGRNRELQHVPDVVQRRAVRGDRDDGEGALLRVGRTAPVHHRRRRVGRRDPAADDRPELPGHPRRALTGHPVPRRDLDRARTYRTAGCSPTSTTGAGSAFTAAQRSGDRRPPLGRDVCALDLVVPRHHQPLRRLRPEDPRGRDLLRDESQGHPLHAPGPQPQRVRHRREDRVSRTGRSTTSACSTG